MGLFGPRLPIDRDELDFQLATFKWLIGQFGPVGERPLILPTPDFFPLSRAEGEAAAEPVEVERDRLDPAVSPRLIERRDQGAKPILLGAAAPRHDPGEIAPGRFFDNAAIKVERQHPRADRGRLRRHRRVQQAEEQQHEN